MFAYTAVEGVELRIDGMETQVRRPRAHRPGRRAFVSGKKKQNTITTTAISDGQGRTLWNGADRPGRMHDQTAVRTEGIAEQLRLHPSVKAEVDEGYRGLANEFPDQVTAPPKKPKDDAPDGRSGPGARCGAARSPAASSSSMPTPRCATGGHRSATPDAAKPTPAHTAPSRDSSPTAPPAPNPARAQHRTGTRPADCLLITHQPDCQASTPSVRERTTQRTDSTHVLAAVRDLTRLELITEAVRAALEEVAGIAGHLLDGLVDEEWGRRYGRPVRLGKNPTKPKTRILAAGNDAVRLLEHLYRNGEGRASGRRVQALRQIVVQNYYRDAAGRLLWRTDEDDGPGLPPSSRAIVSAYDTSARYARHGHIVSWRGFSAHLTETCAQTAPT